MKNFLFLMVSVSLLFSCAEEEITADDVTAIAAIPIEESALTSDGNRGNWVCEQYDRIRRSSFHISNNFWNKGVPGALSQQCVWMNDRNHWGVDVYHNYGTGEIKSYPSIVIGQHYGDGPTYSKGMPAKVSSLTGPTIKWNQRWDKLQAGNSSLDIWFDRDPNQSGRNEIEIMVWINYKNQQPLAEEYRNGSAVPLRSDVNIGGQTYDLYYGTLFNGQQKVYSFLKKNTSNYLNVNLKGFINYVKGGNVPSSKRFLTNSHYLTSVQAGWEIIEGGKCQTDLFEISRVY